MDDYMTLQALQALNNSITDNANIYLAAQTSRQDRKFSREMSDLAWQRNLESWNMQNEYNLPTNQYARQLQGLRDNGLNPNLVYGSSSSIGGAAGSVSPYKFENIHSTAVPQFRGVDSVTNLLSTRLLQTQIAAQEANNRLINARADNEEARLPGTRARSDEAAYRWNYITSEISDSYEAGIRAQVATEYWKGVQVEYNAHLAKNKNDIQYYEACMAEWLNTTKVQGTDMTYRQYLEHYRTLLSAEQYKYIKEQTLNLASQIAYRKKQGELLDLKIVYQEYVNKFAKLGRSFGNDWVNLLLSGLMQLFGSGNTSPNARAYEDPWLMYDVEEAERDVYGK